MLSTLGLLAGAGFVALLASGLVVRSPDTTIDDALAAHCPTAAPGFKLPVFVDGRTGPLAAVWRHAARDDVREDGLRFLRAFGQDDPNVEDVTNRTMRRHRDRPSTDRRGADRACGSPSGR